MTQYTGIDYGRGTTNINHKTGIRYGVIPSNAVDFWNEESESYYGEETCPECGGHVVDYDDNEHAEYTQQHEHGFFDRACENCELILSSDDCYPLDPISWFIDNKDYSAEQGYDSPDIFITKSPYYTLCSFCSPCAPGAGYILDQNPDGIRAYCFGPEFFDGKKAPYKIYSVETNRRLA